MGMVMNNLMTNLIHTGVEILLAHSYLNWMETALFGILWLLGLRVGEVERKRN